MNWLQYILLLVFLPVTFATGLFIYNRYMKGRKRLTELRITNSTRTIMLEAWEQLNETGDPRWLIRDEEDRNRIVSAAVLREAYFDLHDDYSRITGISDKMEKYRDLTLMLMEAYELYADGEEHQMNWINNYRAMIENLMYVPDDSALDFVKYRMQVRMAFEQPIDPTTTTLFEFLQITEVVNDRNAAITAKYDKDVTSDKE